MTTEEGKTITAAAHSQSWRTVLSFLFQPILLVIVPLLFYTLSLLRLMAATIPYPWELDQGEGHNVWSAWLLLHGQGPYLDLNHYPFFDINYPPLHFVLMAPLLWIFGPSLTAGRLLADLCVFGLAAGVGMVVWRYSRHNRWATALGVLLILANPYLYVFGILATVNVSQVMLGIWSLYFLGLALDEIRPDGIIRRASVNYPALLAGLALSLAALYTKQQALDAVVAGFLFVLWRRPRLAIVSAVGFGVVGGGLFLLIDWLTAHQFYTNLVKVNINDFLPHQLLDQGRAYILTHAPLLVLAAAYAIITLRKRGRLSLWLIYLLSTGAFSVAVGKFGASETYFYASITAVAIGASLLYAELRATAPSLNSPVENHSDNLRFRWLIGKSVLIIIGLLVIQVVVFYHTPETPHPWKDFIKGHSGNYVLFGGLPTEEERAAGQRLADTVKAAPPPVLTEEASFAMVNGYDVVTNPSNILVFDQAHLWQGQELTDLVHNRCFSVILLHGHFLPSVVQAQIQAQYSRTKTEQLSGGTYEIWTRFSPPTPAVNCPAGR